MEIIFFIIIGFFTIQYLNFQIATNDKSIQGFIEYLKEKYYTKK